MDMTIRDIMEMFIDPDSQQFELWDNEKEEVVFTGYLNDLPKEFDTAEVTSIDNLDSNRDNTKKEIITLNICCDED